MNSNNNEIYTALTTIAEVAQNALGKVGEERNQEIPHRVDDEPIVCTPKRLPERLLVKAADVAFKINPINMPLFTTFGQASKYSQVLEPQRIAILTSKYWGPKPRRLTVSFMESISAELRVRILSYMNAWAKTGSITFVWTQGTGQVRISRGSGGYYSYLGTDILLVPKNWQTMNLEGFTMNTPESEYKRVIYHETGHTLGCPHEHMRKELVARVDPAKAYDYFWRTDQWDKATVDAQVLTSLNDISLMGTVADQTSIMCYQLPGSITRDGKPILGGTDINETDYDFISRIYPQITSDVTRDGDETEYIVTTTPCDEWNKDEDVDINEQVLEN